MAKAGERALAEQRKESPARELKQWEERQNERKKQMHEVFPHYMMDTSVAVKEYANYRSKGNILPAAVRLDAIFQLMVAFDQLAKACGAEYWIDYGTLLGCYRNGILLPWDKDADISMTEGARDKFRKCVAPVEEGGMGVSLRYPFQLQGRFDRDLIIPGRIFHHPTGTYVDAFVWYEYPRNRSAESPEKPTEIDKQFLWHPWGPARHKDMLFPLSTIECRNIAAGAVDRWYNPKAESPITISGGDTTENVHELFLPHNLSTLPSYTFPAPHSSVKVLHQSFMDLRPPASAVRKFGNWIYGNTNPFDEPHKDCSTIPCHPTDVRGCRRRTCCCHPPFQRDSR